MIQIPTTLPEALQKLESQLSDEDKEKILEGEEWEFVKLGSMFIGEKLKNSWLRAQDSPLRRYFVELEVTNVDDMVDIVLRELYLQLVGKL